MAHRSSSPNRGEQSACNKIRRWLLVNLPVEIDRAFTSEIARERFCEVIATLLNSFQYPNCDLPTGLFP